MNLIAMSSTDVLVLIDKTTGEATIERGWTTGIYDPATTEAHVLELAPHHLVFLDDPAQFPNTPAGSGDRLPRLEVVGPDGRTWWFGALEVQYELPEAVFVRLAQQGTDDAAYRQVVRDLVPAAVQEAFGAYTADRMLDPKQHAAASRQVEASLGELLRPHGIESVRVVASRAHAE